MNILLKYGCALTFATFSWNTPAFANTDTDAEVIWHCSRVPDVVGQSKTDTFQLASVGLNVDAIAISVMDLIDAYSNKPINVDGRPLTACFMPGESQHSAQALKSLGLKVSSMQLQARTSAIVQSKLRLVTGEAEMLSCISKNYPAVGYLSQPVNNERVVPCF